MHLILLKLLSSSAIVLLLQVEDTEAQTASQYWARVWLKASLVAGYSTNHAAFSNNEELRFKDE